MADGFVFKDKIPGIADYFPLYETTGWNATYNASKKKLTSALKKSWYCISVYQEKKLIGFGRLLSDGCLYAVVCDMIVLPEYRNKGIGTEVLKQLVEKCRQSNIRAIWLFAAKDRKDFYAKRGFAVRPDDRPGMYYCF